MASASAILDRACQLTGLNSTAASTERVMALAVLEDVYQRVVMNTECNVASATYTIAATANDYDVSTVVGATPLKIRRMQVTSGGTITDLFVVSEDQLLGSRESTTTPGLSFLVAPMGMSKLMFYPNPNVGDVIRTYYVPTPAALTDATSSSPTAVPSQFHWDVLLSGVVSDLLAKDQRGSDMIMWEEKHERALSRMKEISESFMGDPYPIALPHLRASRRFSDERGR